jgi:hypothetical protein
MGGVGASGCGDWVGMVVVGVGVVNGEAVIP